MDKVLTTISKIKSCEELVKNIAEFIHYPEYKIINSLRKTNLDYKEIIHYMFQSYSNTHENNNDNQVVLPDYVYIILAAVAMILGDIYINRFSLKLSKTYRHNILEILDDENLVIRSNALDMNIEYRDTCFKEIAYSMSRSGAVTTICYKYRIPLYSYLTIAKKLLTEPSWKLSAFVLHKGYIYIDDREKILRLITENVYNLLSSRLKELKSTCEIDKFKQEVLAIVNSLDPELGLTIKEFVNSMIKLKEKTIKENRDKILSTNSTPRDIQTIDDLISISRTIFPPCIRELIENIIKGENLSHHQRFALATFLINIGINLDIILKLFSYSPDFNEKIAKYQIEHLAGLRGSKKKYFMYSCSTMKMLGICRAECGVKNPVTYMMKALKTSKRVESKEELEKQ